MGRLCEITRCSMCPHYDIRGHQFHMTTVKDRWENVVELYFDEYIGFCRHRDRIIFDEDIKNGIAYWCHLPDAEYLEYLEDKLRAIWTEEEAKKFMKAMDTIGKMCE